jgi:hypothetical protein
MTLAPQPRGPDGRYAERIFNEQLVGQAFQPDNPLTAGRPGVRLESPTYLKGADPPGKLPPRERPAQYGRRPGIGRMYTTFRP